jgi:ABC-type multidrug transport system ATPase subunit
MIQLDRVFKFYRTEGHIKVVLDHASMVFQSGRSYGLLGVNGAGKSTTIRLSFLIRGVSVARSASLGRLALRMVFIT